MPRVEYALSFENYLDMIGTSRDKPKLTAALVAAFLGLTLIISGYIYLRLSPPDAYTPYGGLALALSLLSTVLAVPLAFLAKPKSKREDLGRLRREYAAYFADKREIEYDENGWRVEWYDGDDIRSWSVLTAVQDVKSLLVLSSRSIPYWLPKEALDPGDHLSRLRALAEASIWRHETLFTVPMKPTAIVYVAAKVIHGWRRNYARNILCYAGALVALYWIALSNWLFASALSLTIFGVLPLFFLLCEGLYFLRKLLFCKVVRCRERSSGYGRPNWLSDQVR